MQNLNIGKTYQLVEYTALFNQNLKNYLERLGLLPGSKFKVLRSAPLDKKVWHINLKHFSLALNSDAINNMLLEEV